VLRFVIMSTVHDCCQRPHGMFRSSEEGANRLCAHSPMRKAPGSECNSGPASGLLATPRGLGSPDHSIFWP
jgi:hypothetical protein